MAKRPPRASATEPPREFRLIAGEFRGRRLSYQGDPGLRPMKDRTREALFNRLRNCIEGMHAIDLFAGTGAVGLEALSRGAVHLTAWEFHARTAQSLRQNVARLACSDQADIYSGDALALGSHPHLASLLKADAAAPWCVFCCPPYAFYTSQEQAMMDLIANFMRQAPEGSIFVVESDQNWPGAALPESQQWDAHAYSPATLWIHWPPDA